MHFWLLIYSFLLHAPLAHADTVYVHTKDYQWQWGAVPNGQSINETRGWLEGQRPPKLLEATPAIRKLATRYFKLEKNTNIKFAVMAPPRSKNGHEPHFFAWIEWVHKSDFLFDKDKRRWERKAGVARIVIEGEGEKRLAMHEWRYDTDLRDGDDFSDFLSWDAAVIARKMLDFHTARPRGYREKANGPGQSAPY